MPIIPQSGGAIFSANYKALAGSQWWAYNWNSSANPADQFRDAGSTGNPSGIDIITNAVNLTVTAPSLFFWFLTARKTNDAADTANNYVLTDTASGFAYTFNQARLYGAGSTAQSRSILAPGIPNMDFQGYDGTNLARTYVRGATAPTGNNYFDVDRDHGVSPLILFNKIVPVYFPQGFTLVRNGTFWSTSSSNEERDTYINYQTFAGTDEAEGINWT